MCTLPRVLSKPTLPAVTQIEWVLVRFQLTSFMPWSDVRRISHVRAGGMAIRVTEAVNSASARRNVRSSGSGPGQSEGNFRSTGDRSDSARRREGGNWSEQSQQEGEEENAARNDGETLSRINENEESLPRMGHEKKDLWAHGARQADQSSASPAASGSAKWNEDGFEWERVTQASLEYVLGHEFASKYKVMTNRACSLCLPCELRSAILLMDGQIVVHYFGVPRVSSGGEHFRTSPFS